MAAEAELEGGESANSSRMAEPGTAKGKSIHDNCISQDAQLTDLHKRSAVDVPDFQEILLECEDIRIMQS